MRIAGRQWLAAASVLVILTVGGAIAYDRFSNKTANTETRATTNINQVSTRPGSKSQLQLPDGTDVWLNSDSKLTYTNGAFGKDNREVYLTGEAFFDVVKNERIPFIIHTGPVHITVRGTAFNVKAYPQESSIETSLVRGLVEITTTQDPDRKILLKPNEKITIQLNNKQFKNATIHVPPGDTTSLYSITRLKKTDQQPDEIVWMNNQLAFDNERFEELAPKMESWYNVRIRFLDESLRNRRFTGVIEKETLKETLEAMRLSYAFHYELKDGELQVRDK